MLMRAERTLVAGLHAVGLPEVPVYVLRTGRSWVLVEGGVTATASLVLAQLRALVGDLSRISHWFITHAHYDHCGLLPYLVPELPAARVFVPEAALGNFQRPTAQAAIDSMNDGVSADWWQLHGPDERLKAQRRAWSALPLQPLAAGAVVELDGGFRLRAVEADGHCPAQLCFFEETRGWAFTGDALGEPVTADEWCPLTFHDASAYRATLRRVAQLEPSVLCAGHHSVFLGACARRCAADAERGWCDLLGEVQGADAQRLERLPEIWSERYRARSQRFVPDALHLGSMRRMLGLLREVQDDSI
jgi:2-aminobenzoylacetyl-CoA thioesterase